jgi:hypothetical protein
MVNVNINSHGQNSLLRSRLLLLMLIVINIELDPTFKIVFFIIELNGHFWFHNIDDGVNTSFVHVNMNSFIFGM